VESDGSELLSDIRPIVLGEGEIAVDKRVDGPGGARHEIGEMADDLGDPVVRQNNVVGFEVAVDDPSAVSGAEPSSDSRGLPGIDRPFPNPVESEVAGSR